MNRLGMLRIIKYRLINKAT